MATIDRDRSGSEILRKALADIAARQARVGFFEHSKYSDGTPVAYVAAIQELHPQHARPFLRPTIDEQREAWRATLRQGMQAVVNGRIEAAAAFSQFGMLAAGDVRLTISRITSPPLADATIAARQRRRRTPGVSTKPLVDTGLMIQSVTSEVTER